MSVWGGYIQFQNLTHETIKQGKAYHSTTAYGQEEIKLDGLPSGGISAPVPFYTSSGKTDTWGIEITLSQKSYDASTTKAFKLHNAGSTVILQAAMAGDKHTLIIVFQQQVEEDATSKDF